MKEITQLRIGRHSVGIVGLKPLMEEMAAGYADRSNEEVGRWMLDRLERDNYIPASAREDYGRAFAREFRKFMGQPFEEEPSHGIDIKVFGPGCSQCDSMEQLIMEVLAELQLPASVDHVRDIKEIARHGIMGVPALMINGKVVAKGSVPSREKMRRWLTETQVG